mmetsp:Transcript_23067/g.69101  ORF Transcript_23067/g.69101 Transcript_23067/m.69101 type:complete len:370 (+) Transcript_23067:102-1211(+)
MHANVEDRLVILGDGGRAAVDSEQEGQGLLELLVLLPGVLHAVLLGELHGEGLIRVVLLGVAALVLGDVGAPGEPPLAAGLAPEATPRVVLAPACRAEDLLRVVPALRSGGRTALRHALADGADRDAFGKACLRADDLGQGVPVLQVLWVLPPERAAVQELLGHNGAARLSLQHDVRAAVQGPLRRRGAALRQWLHVLRDLGDLRLLVHVRHVLPRGDGEDCAELLAAPVLLRRAHLEAPRLVDAEPHAVLRRLVEHRRRGPGDLLVPLGPRLEVGAGPQVPALLRAVRRSLVSTLDLERGRPGRREEGPGVAHDEPGAEEMLLPSLPEELLLLDQAAQGLHVGGVGDRRDEAVALAAAVRQARAEDGP